MVLLPIATLLRRNSRKRIVREGQRGSFTLSDANNRNSVKNIMKNSVTITRR